MYAKFWTIVLEVYRKSVKSLPFVIMAISPLILAGMIYVIGIVVSNSKDTDNAIALVSDSPEINTALKSSKDLHVELLSEKKSIEKLKDEKIGAILYVTQEKDGTLSSELKSSKTMDAKEKYALQVLLTNLQQINRAKNNHLTEKQFQEMTQQAQIKETHVEFDASGKLTTTKDYSLVRGVVAYAIVIFIYIFISTYSSIIAQEIANEKGTRIMEVMLSSVKAKVHFYGKLVGVLLVCLTNMAIYAVEAAFAYVLFHKADIVKTLLANIDLSQVFTGLFWFVIPIVFCSILLFTVLAALAGSLITRVEDVSKAQMPVVWVGLIGYILSLTFQTDPGNPVMHIANLLPFVSSFTLPMQIAAGVTNLSQILVSLSIMLATMLCLLLFSASIYKNNVLLYSDGGLVKLLKISIGNLKHEKKFDAK